MKIEICSETRTVAIAAVAVLGVMFAIAVFVEGYNMRIVAAFEHGYEEGSVQGAGHVHWVKARP